MTLTIPAQSILSIISTKITTLAFSPKITTEKSVIITSKTTNRKTTILRPIVSSSNSIITNFSKLVIISYYPPRCIENERGGLGDTCCCKGFGSRDREGFGGGGRSRGECGGGGRGGVGRR